MLPSGLQLSSNRLRLPGVAQQLVSAMVCDQGTIREHMCDALFDLRYSIQEKVNLLR
jgi:hypothetical protein